MLPESTLTNDDYETALHVLRVLNVKHDGGGISATGSLLFGAYLLVQDEANQALAKATAAEYNCYSAAASA